MDRTRKDQTTYMSFFHKRSGCYLGIKKCFCRKRNRECLASRGRRKTGKTQGLRKIAQRNFCKLKKYDRKTKSGQGLT